jgi:hypothetical protein
VTYCRNCTSEYPYVMSSQGCKNCEGQAQRAQAAKVAAAETAREKAAKDKAAQEKQKKKY